ncbi:MAG TPA: MBL fold metallo-hydrolase [Chlamydiales bacterium]|nr:MBL fold metallo-hydrolase [Chlamydiales bacterium]
MNGRYKNPLGGNSRRRLFDFFLWKLGLYDDPIPRLPPSKHFSYPAQPLQFDSTFPSAVWIGHSTFLIEVEGLVILTDPIWENYCAPIPFKALKRSHEAPIALSDLPRIDFVLISHNHYDHLDAKTVKHLHAFHPEIQWIVPLGLAKWFLSRNIRRVIELKWWRQLCFSGGSITAVPAQHFSGRGIWDQNRTYWNGYVFESLGKRFYFTGDTGYNPIDFKKIGSEWPHMDLSLIPIGTYVPQKFMQHVHCSPREAVEIHCDVKSRLSLGMHWKTFRLSDEPMERPPYDLYLAMRDKKLAYDQFLAIDPGVYVNW